MRAGSKAIFQILIDGDETHLIKQRNEHKSNDKLSDNKPHHHLHIREALLCNHARH